MASIINLLPMGEKKRRNPQDMSLLCLLLLYLTIWISSEPLHLFSSLLPIT